MTPDKKLQQKGWSHNAYNQVRNKVNSLFDNEDLAPYFKAKKRKGCKANREHVYIKLKESTGWKGWTWTDYQCDLCGKRKFEFDK